jgi:DNA-binding NarL/FixJ family response regulator
MNVAGSEHHPGGRAVATYVLGGDPISQAGLTAQLRCVSSLRIVDEPERAAIAVLVVDEVDEDTARSIRKVLRAGCSQVAAVVTALDDAGVLRAVEAGACTILRRSDAAPDQLAAALIAAVEGHGSLPPDLLGSLLNKVGALQRNVLQPRGLLLNGFTERELEVLRLLADGLDTAEVAAKLAYSERTVKSIVHDVVTRYNLRNRCHAVAYACRAGVI